MSKADDAKQAEPREGKLRWVLGWLVLPATIIAALFLTGVHVGARHPDMALARRLLRAFGAKPGIAESSTPSFSPRPGAKPGEPFAYSAMLRPKQLEKIAEKSFGLGVADLDCVHVCRAYAKAEHDAAIYGIDECKLMRTVTTAPSFMVCRGKLEAVEANEKGDDKPGDKPRE